jgi:hypothetical protein
MEIIKDLYKRHWTERLCGLEAPWLALPLGPVTALDQEQEPTASGGEARGQRGLGRAALVVASSETTVQRKTARDADALRLPT